MINYLKRFMIILNIYLCFVVSIHAMAEIDQLSDDLPWGLHLFESIQEAKNSGLFSAEPEISEDGNNIWGFTEIFGKTAMLTIDFPTTFTSNDSKSIVIDFFIAYDEAVDFYEKLYNECIQLWNLPCETALLHLEGDGIGQTLIPYEHDMELEKILHGETDTRIWLIHEWQDNQEYSLLISHSFPGVTTMSLSIYY